MTPETRAAIERVCNDALALHDFAAMPLGEKWEKDTESNVATVRAFLDAVASPARSCKDLMATLADNGITEIPRLKYEIARKWRAHEISTDQFISDLKGESGEQSEATSSHPRKREVESY